MKQLFVKSVSKFFLMSFFVSNVFAHGGVAPPVDSTNSGGQSHSGFGNLGGSDYEASQVLRKRCVDEDMESYITKIEAACQERNPSFSFSDMATLLDTGASLMTRNKLQSYAASVLASDAYMMGSPDNPMSYPSPSSCHGIGTIRKPPHEEVRESALSVENAVSAALLDAVYNVGTSDVYRERLKRNYPYLYTPAVDNFQQVVGSGKSALFPFNEGIFNFSLSSLIPEIESIPMSDRGRTKVTAGVFQIMKQLKNGLGNAFLDNGNMFDHSTTMAAFDAKMQTDPIFKYKIEKIVKELQKEHSRFLTKKLDKICQMSMEDIARSFPGIFDQFIIDSDELDRSLARYSLCQKDFYYNPNTFDSDCDGVKDSKDPAPNDQFNPEPSFTVTKDNHLNPPFIGGGTRNIKKVGNTILVKRPLSIQLPNGIADNVSKNALSALQACNSTLGSTLESAYQELAKDQPQYQGVDFKMEFVFEQTTTGSPDFMIHKCWCSTCSVWYNDPTLGRTKIPKDTCRADFTPEMLAGLNDATLNPDPNLRSWMMQEDAENLTIASLGDCKTIQHEMMHTVGLADEYSADYYPFNLIGEHDSLMNNGEKLFARHIGDLLSPMKCSRTQ